MAPSPARGKPPSKRPCPSAGPLSSQPQCVRKGPQTLHDLWCPALVPTRTSNPNPLYPVTILSPSVLYYGGERQKAKSPIRKNPPRPISLDESSSSSVDLRRPSFSSLAGIARTPQSDPPPLTPQAPFSCGPSGPPAPGHPCVPQCMQSVPTRFPQAPSGTDIMLSFGTINLGGNITIERFSSTLTSLQAVFSPLPLFLALTEFRPQGPPVRFSRLALQCGYHLLFNARHPCVTNFPTQCANAWQKSMGSTPHPNKGTPPLHGRTPSAFC